MRAPRGAGRSEVSVSEGASSRGRIVNLADLYHL